MPDTSPQPKSPLPLAKRKGTIVVPKGSNPHLIYCWNNRNCKNKIDYSIKIFDPKERDVRGYRVQKYVRTRHFYRCDMCGCALYCKVECMQQDFFHHRVCCQEFQQCSIMIKKNQVGGLEGIMRKVLKKEAKTEQQLQDEEDEEEEDEDKDEDEDEDEDDDEEDEDEDEDKKEKEKEKDEHDVPPVNKVPFSAAPATAPAEPIIAATPAPNVTPAPTSTPKSTPTSTPTPTSLPSPDPDKAKRKVSIDMFTNLSVEDIYKMYYNPVIKPKKTKSSANVDDRVEYARLNARMFNCSKFYVNRKDNNGKRYDKPVAPVWHSDEDEEAKEKQKNVNLDAFKKTYSEYDSRVPPRSKERKLDGPGEEYDNFGGRPVIYRRRGELRPQKQNPIGKFFLKLPLICFALLIVYLLISDPDEFMNQIRQVAT